MITAKQYAALKAKLDENKSASEEDRMSPETVARAQAAMQEFDDQYLSRATADRPRPEGDGAQVIQERDAPLAGFGPLRPGINPAVTEDSLVSDVKRRLDPSMPLQPQVLSIQPATGHPKGDQAAKDEWIRGDLNNPNGVVLVYDAPAKVVREKLMENPGLFKALGYDAPFTADAIATIQSGDSIHQAYNHYLWRQTADAAVKAGMTPYRYSKAPWLKDGAGGSTLDNLSTKLKGSALPALDKATAFIMGVDNTANFGATNAAAQAGLLEDKAEPGGLVDTIEQMAAKGKRKGQVGTPIGGGKDEVVGGIAEANPTAGENADMLREEHPGYHTAGQVVGAVPGAVEAAGKLALKGAGKAVGLASKAAGEAVEGAGQGLSAISHWNPANQLWEWITSTVPTAPAQTMGQAAGRTALAALGGTAAAGVHQGVTEAVQAGANLAGTGETGTTLGRAATNIGNAAVAGGLGALPGGLLQQGASRYAHGVEEGPRYAGLPGRLNRQGLEPKFGKGYEDTAEMAAHRATAKARDVRPIDVYAEELEKPLAGAAKGQEAEAKMRVRDSQSEVYNSREGKMLLPAQNLVETSVDLLRKRTAKVRGRGLPTSVGTPNAQNPVRGILNANIEGVSVAPVNGAVALDLDEATAYLNPVWRRRTLRAAQQGRAVSRPGAGPAREVSPEPMGPEPKQLGQSQALATTRPGTDELANTPKGIERVRPYRGRVRELEAKDMTTAAPDAAVRGSRRPTAGEATGSELPRVEARNLGPEARQGSRWRRTESAAPKGKSRFKEETEPQSWAEQLRAQGVRKVYVLPRRYNAQHHESAIQLLRKSRDVNAKDRDLIQVYQAALRDRDARPWRGQPGGWSALQNMHEQEISRAKDIRRRVAPAGKPDGSYKAVQRASTQRAGQSKDLSAVEQMAERAGVAQSLKGARSLDPLDRLTARITETPGGKPRAPWSPVKIYDQATIKGAYPVARGVAKSGIGGGATGKATRIGAGNDEAEERRKKDEAPKAKAYAKATEGDRKKASAEKKRRKPPEKKRRIRREEETTE